jgi:hypothetical protein
VHIIALHLAEASFILIQCPIRVDKHLRITLDPLVEFLVRSRRVVDVDLMRNNETWLGLSRDDHVSEVSIIGFHVTLAGPDSKTLLMLAYTMVTTRRRLAFSNNFPKEIRI